VTTRISETVCRP